MLYVSGGVSADTGDSLPYKYKIICISLIPILYI